MNIDLGKILPASIVICDVDGIIVYMNNRAEKNFESKGGYNLIGKSLFECHNERSSKIIKELISQKKSIHIQSKRKALKNNSSSTLV